MSLPPKFPSGLHGRHQGACKGLLEGEAAAPGVLPDQKACADAEKLELYDSDEEERESYSSGERTLYVDSVTGEFVGMLLIARSREELKKLLLLEAHSFVPDPDSDAPGMTSFFYNMGQSWMFRGEPECWQQFDDYCSNPDFEPGSLTWEGEEHS